MDYGGEDDPWFTMEEVDLEKEIDIGLKLIKPISKMKTFKGESSFSTLQSSGNKEK